MGKITNAKSGRVKNKKFKKDISVNDFDASSQESELRSNTTLNIKNPFKLNPKQKTILDRMCRDDTKMVQIDGKWGTSKTFLAVLAALQLLQQGKADKIYYIRTPCESSDTAKIGTLPGDLALKLVGFTGAISDKLEELLPYSIAQKLIKDEVVECLPPGYLRGRSFDKSILICDEASNFSTADLLLISSRMGPSSRMFLVGDSFQNDIGRKSGFERFFNTFNDEESKEYGIYCFEMKDPSDIVRSGIIRFIMEKTGVI
jgi:phosphate starvation-inducible protein PhoH and related proteins